MGYAEDIDRLREYVRTTSRADYRRMREVSADVVQVEFIANADEHAAAIARFVDDPKHIRVIQADSSGDRAERAQRYWEPMREQLAASSFDDQAVTSLAFGHDDEGPLLFVGVYPLTAEVAARVTAKFSPHRVRVQEKPAVTAIIS